ncbi:MAG: hypothetical protein NC489_17835, partial [Ruminococcus flavefaciens]|nr:hypothetical protein [Ruminococcus flavefaciens]
YIMIGGYDAENFLGAWTHCWDYMTEIEFTEGSAEASGNSDVLLHYYGWTGYGVDFAITTISGWDDGDLENPMTNSDNQSVYETDDRYLIFDWKESKSIGTVKMTTTNEDILSGPWAVYGANALTADENTWDVLMTSSEMQLTNGVIEVPVNGAYQYIMIGGYDAENFLGAWTHSWDYMTEIEFVD